MALPHGPAFRRIPGFLRNRERRMVHPLGYEPAQEREGEWLGAAVRGRGGIAVEGHNRLWITSTDAEYVVVELGPNAP